MSFHLMNYSNSLLDVQAKDEILKCNSYIADYNLALTQQDCEMLLQEQKKSLTNYGRIEFGANTILHLIEGFYDSPYFNNNNFATAIAQLLDIFYYFKNETMEQVGDEDLINWLKKYLNDECNGSIELLMSRDMEKLVKAVKEGTKIEDIEKEETSILFNVDEQEENFDEQ